MNCCFFSLFTARHTAACGFLALPWVLVTNAEVPESEADEISQSGHGDIIHALFITTVITVWHVLYNTDSITQPWSLHFYTTCHIIEFLLCCCFLLFWLLTCVFVSSVMKLYKSMHSFLPVCALQHIFPNSNCVLFSQKLKLMHKTVSIKYIGCFTCVLLYDEPFVESYITRSQSEIEKMLKKLAEAWF